MFWVDIQMKKAISFTLLFLVFAGIAQAQIENAQPLMEGSPTVMSSAMVGPLNRA